MKKSFILLFSILFFAINVQAFAIEQCEEGVCKLEEAPTEQEIQNNLKKEQITAFIKKFEKFQNKHDLLELKRIYAEEFVNSDGFNRNQLFALMKRTFLSYPDLKTDIKINDIVVIDDYAMVFVEQKLSATTQNVSQITGDKGIYVADLNSILYLKKINDIWKIYSENVTFENSRLAYGSAKEIIASINAPQKVLVDTDYCAGVDITLPAGFSAIASINNTQIVEDFNLAGETFRQVPPDKGSLERVLRANNKNNNEAVVASIGFTQTGEDMFKKPKVEISGIIMLMKRVDVIPENSNLTCQKESKSDKK